jgi:hypothetical protein
MGLVRYILRMSKRATYRCIYLGSHVDSGQSRADTHPNNGGQRAAPSDDIGTSLERKLQSFEAKIDNLANQQSLLPTRAVLEASLQTINANHDRLSTQVSQLPNRAGFKLEAKLQSLESKVDSLVNQLGSLAITPRPTFNSSDPQSAMIHKVEQEAWLSERSKLDLIKSLEIWTKHRDTYVRMENL